VHSTAADGFTDLDGVLDTIGRQPDVLGAAPFIRKEAIVTGGYVFGDPRNKGAVFWGVDPDRVDTVQPLSKYLKPQPAILGALKGGEVPRIILGSSLATSLYAAIGDTIVLTTAKGEFKADRIEAESTKCVVVGFFETGMYEFDSQFGYMDLEHARRLFGYTDGGATLIGVKVRDLMQADLAAERIREQLPSDHYVSNWKILNKDLFQWIKLEKVVMFLLLALIILIAAFNIVGILTMMVQERRREIAILMSMGVNRKQVLGVFLITGTYLGGMGVTIGSVVGLAAIWALETFGLPIPGNVYFVDTVPVVFQWLDFVLVCGVTLIMSITAGLWPSFEAGSLKPMEILRYE
ncbi:MAG: hypothetical protein CSA24_03030, partial [Deltaproteobacteria bacterium]